MTATDFPALIAVLAEGGVEFIVIGGVAATIHGSAHITVDLDLLYRRTPENVERLAAALAAWNTPGAHGRRGRAGAIRD